MNVMQIKRPPIASLCFKLLIVCAVLFALLNPRITLAAPKNSDFQNAVQAFENGNWSLAQQKITGAIKTDPSNADAYFYQGLIYGAYITGGRRIKDAQTAFDQAIKLNPRHSGAYTQKGQLYFDEGQFDVAIENYTQAIQIEPSASSYRGRGVAYVALGEHKKAIEDFTQVLKLEPQDELTLIERAKQYIEVGKYQEAIDDTTAAMQTNAELADIIVPMAHKHRAVAYMMLGDKENAISDAQKACSLGDECTMLDTMKHKGWVK